jgi:predicted permease
LGIRRSAPGQLRTREPVIADFKPLIAIALRATTDRGTAIAEGPAPASASSPSGLVVSHLHAMSDLKSAVRALRKTPGFTAVAVLTIAVGIAANTALFSVFDRLILNPVALPKPSSLVAVWTNNPSLNFNAPAVSWPRYQEIQRSAQSFASLGVSAFDNFTLTGNGAPEQLVGLRVSATFFPTVGIMPARGRNFSAEEDVPNGPNVVIISHELWQSRFGGRPSIIGENITLSGLTWQVIGIMPPRLTNPWSTTQVFAPRVFEVGGLTREQVQRGAGYMQPIARLKPGVSLEQAGKELAAISKGYAEQFGSHLDANNTSEARSFVGALTGNLRPTFYTLLGAVAFVLLIACANVASLFLGRLTSRHKEIAVRQSLGATRALVVRQFLIESLVFSAVAGVLGMVLGFWALSAIQSAFDTQLPPNTTLTLDWRALAFTAGVTMLSAILVGLVPSMQASKTQLVEVLKDSTRGSSSARGGRFHAGLIIVEVALSVVLLVGSSLLLLSFVQLQRTPPGFETKGVAAAFVGVSINRYKTQPEQVQFFAQVVENLKLDPRVKSAATVIGLPLAGFNPRSPYSVAGRPIKPLPERPLAGLGIVHENYFDTLKIPLREGRFFTEHDREGAPGVAIVNETLAKRLFPGESALGKVLLRGANADIQHEIVGVIRDVKTNGLSAPVPDEIYYPMRQLGRAGMAIVARTDTDAAALQAVIRSAVTGVDKDQPISFFATMENNLANSLGVQRIVASLTGIFAGMALVLAAVGLYSVLAYAVSQRTNEIGIRMALGAQPGQVIRLVMRSGLRLVAIGLVLGLAAAAGTARLIQTLLFNVQPLDPLIYAGVALLFAFVAALACLVPSLRASRIDPLVALRAD